MGRIKFNIKRITVIVILFSQLVSVASAQERTSYGVRYNRNPNLRFQTEANQSEVSLRGHYSSEGMGGGGAFTKIYNADKVVGLGWGTNLSATYHEKVGSLMDLAVKPTIKFGRSVQLRLSALAGVGSTAYTQLTQSPDGSAKHEYVNSCWAFKAGGEGSLFIPFSKYVGMELFGGYQHSFADPKSRELHSAEGWEITTDYRLNSWYAGLGVVFNLNAHQTSGDWCWVGGVYGGYSFTPTNQGIVACVEVFNTKKFAARVARIVGLGVEQVFGEEKKTNSVYGKVGYDFFPNGSQSVIFFTTAAKVGVGEYYKVDEGATSTGSFSMRSCYFALGAKASAEVGVGLHFGGWTIAALGEFGGHLVGGTKFESLSDVEYSGTTSKLSGWDGQAKMRVTFAF